MEQKYIDAIMALSELLLDQRRVASMKDWEIESLKKQIIELEKSTNGKE